MERQVNFVLTKDDMLKVLDIDDGQTISAFKSIFRFIGAWIFSLVIFLAFGFFLGGREKLMDPNVLQALLAGWLLLAVFIIFCNTLEYLISKRKQKKIDINDERIGVDFTFLWDDNALAIRRGNIKGHYPWRLFHGFIEHPDFIAFYTGEKTFHILPKRALSQPQLLDLRAILLEEIRKIRAAEKQG